MHRALTLALLLFTVLALYPATAAGKTLGRFNGLWLVENPQGNESVTIRYAAASPLVFATTPDPRVAKALEGIAFSLAREKKLGVVDGGWYRIGWSTEPTGDAPGASRAASGDPPLMLIVVPDGYEWLGERIARLHPDLRVEVMNWSSVASACGRPAPPPPGYVEPSELSRKCGAWYNATKALCLVSLERRLLGEGLRYLLLVGGANVTPPIYYYSPILESVGVGSCPGMVPTDYWFMDPDYDWVPEVAVGRIPFTDPEKLGVYLASLEEWLRGAGRGALMTGGAPFQTTLLLGEKAVAEASLSTRGVPVDELTLTLGGYKPLSVQERVGRYRLYYIVSHGIGDMLLDVFPRGLWGSKVDVVLAPKELGPNTGAPGVYVTPACLSAYWDTDVIEPSFHPPSVAVALLEKGYAVAYYGSSRIAIGAVTDVTVRSDGSIDVRNIGALYLTSLAASLLLQEKRIGDAIVKALASYSSSARGVAVAYTAQGAEDVAVLTMLEFVLLGDPAAPAPYSNATIETPPKPTLSSDRSIPAVLLYQALASMVEGYAPLKDVGRNATIELVFNECPDQVSIVALRRYYSYTLASIEQEPVTIRGAGGASCSVIARLDAGPALHYIVIRRHGAVERLVLAAAGLTARPVGLEMVELRAVGLDLLRTTEDEPIGVYLNGTLVAWIPGAVDKAVLNLTLRGPGVLELRPWRLYAGLVAGTEAATSIASILVSVFRVHVDPPRVTVTYQPRGVLITLHGVDAYALRGAVVQEKLGADTLLVCSPHPVELVVRVAGSETTLTIPMSYECGAESGAGGSTGSVGGAGARTPRKTWNATSVASRPSGEQGVRVEERVVRVASGYAGSSVLAAYAAAALITGVAAFIAVYAWPRGRR